MKKVLSFFIALGIFLSSSFIVSRISAAAVSWDGGAGTANWADALNWDNDAVPTADDDVTVSTSSGTITVNIAASTTINSLVIGVEGGATTATLNFSYNAIANGALIIDAGNLTVNSGSTITHTTGTSIIVGAVYIDVQTGDATVSGSINVAAKGHSPRTGLGAGGGGSGYGGGGHGGTGASGTAGAGGGVYGSVTAPVTYGSAGGDNGNNLAGRGGGIIRINAANTLNVTGTITAAGGGTWDGAGRWTPGAGAGGSVYVTAGTLVGNGTITVNGGTNNSGGGTGGGGRISLNYNEKTYTGSVTAYGGTGGAGTGGAGTIFEKTPEGNGNLILDNNNSFTTSDTNIGRTPLESYTLDTLTIRNYARASIESSTNVTYTNLDWSTKGVILDRNTNGVLAPFTTGGEVVIPSTSYYVTNVARTFNSLLVDGYLVHSKNTSAPSYLINLIVNNDATISATGQVSLASMGYNAGYGPGTNACAGGNCGGAGHGGIGGSGASYSGGSAYDDLGAPSLLGSGGPTRVGWGASGGGAFKLIAGGSFTHNGTINVNGGHSWSQSGSWCFGAGSAGSVYVVANSLNGNGSISAVGGNGQWCSGGGAGGRVALHYTTNSDYSGAVTLSGGSGGYVAPQHGTKLIKALSGEMVSSPIDTGDPATLLYDLAWTEVLGSGTDAKIQLRTAPDSGSAPGTWTDWMGPDGAGTYFTEPDGSENLPNVISDVNNDQWLQYKVLFTATSGDENIPVISDITLTYVVNTTPTVTITNTPEQSTSGVVTVTHTMSDPEESTLTTYLATDIGVTLSSEYAQYATTSASVSDASKFPSTGTLVLDNEMITYTGKSGNSFTGITRAVNSTTDVTHTAGTSVLLVATGTTGTGSVSVSGEKTITWSPATDFTNLETTTATLYIIVNDGNLANQVGSDSVGSITLDTKAPVSTDIFLNNRTNLLTLQASDSNSILMKISNDADLTADGLNADSGNWITYTTSKAWSLALDPATVYVQYKDQYGNQSATLYTTGPQKLTTFLIQDASNPDTEEWRLFISWPAISAPANGFDYYQVYRSTDNANFSAYNQVTDITQNYFVDTDLDSATTYYYKATVVDDHGNESDYNDIASAGSASRSGVGLTPDGSGGGDFTAPVISAATVSETTTTTATITWTTDELSNSTVGYGTDTNYTNERGVITMVTAHSVTLTNLSPNTTYYYRLISYDAMPNKATQENSSTMTFTTLDDTDGPVISNIKAVSGETSAGITWSTSEPATSLVEYSTDETYSESSSSAILVQGHAITLSNLSENTIYNYRVTSIDANNNTTVSPSYTFATSAVTVDTTAPTISNISVSDLSATSAKISWSTSEKADGKVEYGESSSYERGIAEGNHAYKTSKDVTVIGLSPSTTYHYRVVVVDEAGNTNSSSDATFTTSSQSDLSSLTDGGTSSGANAPTISSDGATVTDITGTTATVAWSTSKKSTSIVYYKVKGGLDSPVSTGSDLFVTAHSVTLTGLTPASTYEYQVKSTDVSGSYAISKKYEFTTTLPGVAAVKVVDKTSNSATLQWTTVVPTTTIIEYTNAETRETKRYSNSSQVTNHIAQITGLSPSTVYAFEILIADDGGNLARSDQYSFVTGTDYDNAIISSINNRSTIVSGQNKVQTVITWVTNEPATSQVDYALGSGTGDYDQKTPENNDFVLNHITVISNLKPGSVYRYRVTSKDRAGNLTESEPFVLLTPQREVSALDVILQNLESSFGWARKITN